MTTILTFDHVGDTVRHTSQEFFDVYVNDKLGC